MSNYHPIGSSENEIEEKELETGDKDRVANGLSRRAVLQTGGALGGGGLLGITGIGVDTATAASNEIHLDYDNYDSWDEVYNRSTGESSNISLVSSPTYSGNTSVQIGVPEDETWGISTGYDFDDDLTELNGRIRFALNSNWEMSGTDTCRLWNCAIAQGTYSSGCDGAPDGWDGWSNRMYVTSQGTSDDGPYNLLSYTYHMDQNESCGDEELIDNVSIEPGVWYEFEYYVHVNTVDGGQGGDPNSDGIVRYWLDGQQIHEETNRRFTVDHINNGIQTNGPVMHYGGSETAPRSLYAYYDDHSMALNGTF
ncbi:hypothetical protein [Natrononativus amylolyticus]|uniref:hypothetical protein n=1 Tax=Natrononativus amylolyticus TaxID=2963434 RepID=UPI0020CE3903|nr:hypothetical protein [Natrononativus amylolyticus]